MSSVFITFESIRRLSQSYVQRIGPADECSSAIGHVTMGFSMLEGALEKCIAELINLSPIIAPAITSEMSFKNKIAVLSSLVKIQPSLRKYNCGSEDAYEMWNDIVKMLFKSEELRNTLIHSRWSLSNGSNIQRAKTTAKASKGIRVVIENLDSAYILDVYDYILNVACFLEDFFIVADEEKQKAQSNDR